MIRTLDDLAGDAGPASFLAHVTARRRLHIPSPAQGRAADLLPWAAFDRLLAADGLRPERLRVMLRNREAERGMYRDGASGALRADTLMTMAEQGATLVVNVICEVAAPIGELAAALERRLDRNIHANCYASFGERSAFEAHVDGHDVLVVQIHGAKRWRCFGAGDAPEWQSVLEAGDVLFVPQGDRHDAVPARRPSVHLSFALGREDASERARGARALRRVAAFAIAGRLTPALPLVPALRRRIDLRVADPAEVELHIGGRPVRLPPLQRRALHVLIEHDRMAFASLAAGLEQPTDAPDLSEAVCALARKGLIGIGA